MKTPREQYQVIRAQYPNRPFGDHWDGVGWYCGGGCWADPKEVGQQGEAEIQYKALRRSRTSPQ